jgi:membrane fusion protein (multidrug efflux system)
MNAPADRIAEAASPENGALASSRPTGVKRFRNWPAMAIIALGLAAAAGGYVYWHYVSLYPSTDNAYLQANVVQVAATVAGVVDEVPVKSFQAVKAGDVLMKIDERRFEGAVKGAQDRLRLAQAEKISVEEAQVNLQRAQQELDAATLKAPVDGILGKVSIRPGSMARPGQALFPIVDTSRWWVDANFKETDLARIRPGQKVTVYLDIYPDRAFSGEVEAVSPVSTTAFSLLPPENATGSWIKLTQRFPVRISLIARPDDPPMRIGASASVIVDTTDAGPGTASR